MWKVSSRQGRIPLLPTKIPAGTKFSHVVIASARVSISLKKSIEVHFNRSKIFLLYFYDAYDVGLWEQVSW